MFVAASNQSKGDATRSPQPQAARAGQRQNMQVSLEESVSFMEPRDPTAAAGPPVRDAAAPFGTDARAKPARPPCGAAESASRTDARAKPAHPPCGAAESASRTD